MSTDELVSRARRGDLTNLNLAGLVRLSHLVRNQEDVSEGERPTSGRDIKSVDEQENDTKAYTLQRGGKYVYTYPEPDTSAWKRRRVELPDGSIVYRVVRPVFEGALNDLKRGLTPDGQRLDGLVVYDIDRLTRDNRHLEDAIEVVQHHRRLILDYTDTLDLLTDNGRTIARMLVAAANKQSSDTGRRVARKHRALQRAGIPTGGRRPFGWQDDKRTLNEVEADAIRKAVERVIKGSPISAISATWNNEGLQTPFGNNWQTKAVKDVLRNPRICGYRARAVRTFYEDTGTYSGYYMEVVKDSNSTPINGQWDSIVTVDQWEAVIAVIGDRAAQRRGGNARVYLFTGLLRCGLCGARLRANKAIASRPKEPFRYTCNTKANGGCGGLGITGPRTDEYLTELVIQMYEREAQARHQATDRGPWPKQAELEQVRTDLCELTLQWRKTPRGISSERYFALLPDIESDETRLKAEQQVWTAETVASARQPASIRVNWTGYTLAEQRAYVEDMLNTVVVHPMPAGGRPRFDPGRLEPVPHAQAKRLV